MTPSSGIAPTKGMTPSRGMTPSSGTTPARRMSTSSVRLTAGSLRELSTVGIVSALAAAYGAILFVAADILTVVAHHNGGSAGAVLGVVAVVFILIALFVSAIVISNGVDTVIAGRRAQLRLLRLIGASGRQLRTGLVRAVAQVSALGAGLGAVAGTVIANAVRIVLVHNGTLPTGDYPTVNVGPVGVAVAMVVTAVAATYIGSRKTLESTAVVPVSRPRSGRLRSVAAGVLMLTGAAFLALACVLGEQGSLAGFGVAFLGAAATSLGLLIGAGRVVPSLVAVCGRALGAGAAATVARKNAISDPLRTTRSTLGLLIGVTLVTTIAAGMSSLSTAVGTWTDLTPEQAEETGRILDVTTAIMIGIISISAVIAAVGFVSTMSLTVIGRTREIGMLRAMGFTTRQVRSLIFLESIALSGTAVATGLILGIIFGAVGAQSLVGAATSGIPFGLPWPALLAIVVGTVTLAVLASVPPSRRAVAVAPVDALAVA